MSLARLLLFVGILIGWMSESIAYIAAGDSVYVRYFTKYGDAFFDPKDRGIFLGVEPYLWHYHERYQDSFAFPLHQAVSFTLTSERNQIPNAFATISPFLQHVLYRGSHLSEDFAVDSFLQIVTAHEYAHLYQLDAKSSVPLALNKTFGNLTFLSWFPLFIFPNTLHPRWMMEGNAVLNESLWNQGGRLHSGEIRSLVYQLLMADDYTFGHFMNSQLTFPMEADKYFMGGYFFAYLAEKYGRDQANQIFIKHGKKYFNPFSLHNSFSETFFHGTESLYIDWQKSVRDQASEFQKFSPQSSPLVTAMSSPFLIRDKSADGISEVRGIFNQELQSDPLLLTVQAQAGQQGHSVKLKQMVMPNGPLIRFGGQLFSSISRTHRVGWNQYGLFDEGFRIQEGTEGHYFSDQKEEGLVSIDVLQSMDGYKIVSSDGRAFEKAVSLPKMDDQKNIYYFKQNGRQKILFRNSQELGRFESFYAKVADIDSQGAVYFIANTKLGSTVFAFKKDSISPHMVIPADNIVEFKLTPIGFVVVTVERHGYKVFAIESDKLNLGGELQPIQKLATEKSLQPQLWNYEIEAYPAVKLEESSVTQSDAHQGHPVGPLDMRLNYWNLNVLGNQFGANGLFQDGLGFHQIGIQGAIGFFGESSAAFQYAFRKYTWDFIFEASQGSVTSASLQSIGQSLQSSDGSISSSETVQRVSLGVQRPLFVSGLWSSDLNLQGFSRRNFDGYSETGYSGALSLRYQRSYGRNFLPFRSLLFQVGGESGVDLSTLYASQSLNYGLGREWFLQLGGFQERSTSHFLQSAGGLIGPLRGQNQITPARDFFGFHQLGFLSGQTAFYDEDYAQLRFKLIKPFETFHFYDPNTLISFRRLGFFVSGLTAISQLSDVRNRFSEAMIGLSAELVLAHNLVAPIEIGYFQLTSRSTEQIQGQTGVAVKLNINSNVLRTD